MLLHIASRFGQRRRGLNRTQLLHIVNVCTPSCLLRINSLRSRSDTYLRFLALLLQQLLPVCSNARLLEFVCICERLTLQKQMLFSLSAGLPSHDLVTVHTLQPGPGTLQIIVTTSLYRIRAVGFGVSWPPVFPEPAPTCCWWYSLCLCCSRRSPDYPSK